MKREEGTCFFFSFRKGQCRCACHIIVAAKQCFVTMKLFFTWSHRCLCCALNALFSATGVALSGDREQHIGSMTACCTEWWKLVRPTTTDKVLCYLGYWIYHKLKCSELKQLRWRSYGTKAKSSFPYMSSSALTACKCTLKGASKNLFSLKKKKKKGEKEGKIVSWPVPFYNYRKKEKKEDFFRCCRQR